MVQGVEHLGQHLLVEGEGDTQLGVLHEVQVALQVEIQEVRLVVSVPYLGIQDMDLGEGGLWVELVAWILVVSHWEC